MKVSVETVWLYSTGGWPETVTIWKLFSGRVNELAAASVHNDLTFKKYGFRSWKKSFVDYRNSDVHCAHGHIVHIALITIRP